MKKPVVNHELIRKRYSVGIVQFLSLATAIIALGIWGCEDERKAPVVPGTPTYSSTITILNDGVSNGDTLSALFTLRDTLTQARLFITGTLLPDAGLSLMDALNEEVRVLDSIIVRLSARILDLELIPDSVRTPEENRELDSLRIVRLSRETEKNGLRTRIDSLDTRLDDRFKVGIALDDEVFVHPRAIYLDSSAVPNHLTGGERVLWGQGFFLANPDPSGWRGKTMVLNMARFWVADETYYPHTKPPRPSDPDALPELEPKEWLTRLTPGRSHTLKIFFGSDGTQTRLTVSLYVVYKSAG